MERPYDPDPVAQAIRMAKWAFRQNSSVSPEQVAQYSLDRIGQHAAAAQREQQVVQTAGEVNNVFISQGGHLAHSADPVDGSPSLAELRQKFHFDVLKLKMMHAQWMIFISVFAVAVGVVAMVAGVVMAFANTGSPHGYVTGASGLAASLGGGALHRHAKRAMADLTEAVKRNEDKIDVDHQIEVATTLIDRVQDKGVKDRLNSAAALKALNIHPNADTMFNSLLAGEPPKEIEPGETDR
ncbi:TRADD-N-associated membrane domain-containing protein [Streptomyces sp. NPDC001220]